jgi:hypothetical protein
MESELLSVRDDASGELDLSDVAVDLDGDDVVAGGADLTVNLD